MGLGLTLLTGLGTLPLLLILWVVGTTFGVVLIAEALERTRGLAPATFGGAFWLACGFVVLLVVIEMARWFAPRAEKGARRGCLAALLTRPLIAVLLLFLPCILLVRCDLGGTDLPDILTTTALLCVLGYGLFVLPIAFVASAIRLARWLWRVGSIPLIYAAYAVNVGTLNAVRRFQLQAALDMFMAATKTGLIVVAAALGFGLADILGGFTLASLLAFGLSIVFVTRFRPTSAGSGSRALPGARPGRSAAKVTSSSGALAIALRHEVTARLNGSVGASRLLRNFELKMLMAPS